MQEEVKNEMYEVSVRPHPGIADTLILIVDGEEQVAEGFEFAAPYGGTGLKVRRIVRLELGGR